MSSILFFKFLHVLSVGFFGGALVAMLITQGGLQRAVDGSERKGVSALLSSGLRLAVYFMYLGFASGLVLLFQMFAPYGAAKVMSCAPVYVHIMLGFGIFAIGFAQVWQGKVRKGSAALSAGNLEEARGQLNKGRIFAWLSLAAVLASFFVAVMKVPNPARSRCVPPSAMIETTSESLPG